MAHVTIYRGLDGLPAWATISGVEPGHPIIEQLEIFISSAANTKICAFSGDITFEVV